MEEQKKAMDRLRDEMAAAKDGPGIAVLGEYMTERLLKDGSIAPNILAAGKTLAGAFSAIRAQAKKEQKGGFACIDDERAYRITCQYYGVSPHQSPAATASQTSSAACGGTFPCEGKARRGRINGNDPQALADDALDLDALLGG